MAPTSTVPSSTSPAIRTLCSPAKEKSIRRQIPFSNTSRCSGRLTDARRRASARVDSPWPGGGYRVDSRPRWDGRRGARICPGISPAALQRWCCAVPGGERGSKLAAGADAELGEDLAQVVGDGSGADEQLRGDLRVGGAVAGQAGDQRFLRGQGIGRLDGVLPGVPAGRPQLDARPSGKRRGADGVEDLVRAAELIAGVTPAPLAAQPLAVQQAGAGQVHPQPGTAEAVDRLAVEAFRMLAV